MQTSYFRGIRCNLRGFAVISLSEHSVELSGEQFFTTSKIVSNGKAKSQVRIFKRVGNIWHNILIVHRNWENLNGKITIT